MERPRSTPEGQASRASGNHASQEESHLPPGVASEAYFLRSLRYQVPVELYSLKGTFVGYGTKKYSEDEARQRNKESNQRYEKTPRAKARKNRYYQTDKGKAAMDRANKAKKTKSG